LNVEELADMAMRKVIHVADTAAPALKDQGPGCSRRTFARLSDCVHASGDQVPTEPRFTNKLRDRNPEIADIILRI